MLAPLSIQMQQENTLQEIRIEQQKAYALITRLQSLCQGCLRAASQSSSSAIKDEYSALQDFSDIYDRMEEQPEKAPVLLKRVSKSTLEDLLTFIARKLESFTSEQDLQRELTVGGAPFKHMYDSLTLLTFFAVGAMSAASCQSFPHNPCARLQHT